MPFGPVRMYTPGGWWHARGIRGLALASAALAHGALARRREFRIAVVQNGGVDGLIGIHHLEPSSTRGRGPLRFGFRSRVGEIVGEFVVVRIGECGRLRRVVVVVVVVVVGGGVVFVGDVFRFFLAVASGAVALAPVEERVDEFALPRHDGEAERGHAPDAHARVSAFAKQHAGDCGV